METKQSNSKKINSDKSGFTLIEVIIVIAILSILAGSMVPMVSQQIKAAREDATQAEMEHLQRALLAHARDTGTFPPRQKTSIDSLAALEKKNKAPAGWRGPYIVGKYEEQDYTRDAWNIPYHYETNPSARPEDQQIKLVSLGPDRKLGTKDDVQLTIQMPQEEITHRIDKTTQQLKLLEGDLYSKRSDGAPEKYTILARWQKDGWGNIFIYQQQNAFSALIYSKGPNGIDDRASGDDLYRALIWTPKFKTSGEGGSGGSARTCTKKDKKTCEKEKIIEKTFIYDLRPEKLGKRKPGARAGVTVTGIYSPGSSTNLLAGKPALTTKNNHRYVKNWVGDSGYNYMGGKDWFKNNGINTTSLKGSVITFSDGTTGVIDVAHNGVKKESAYIYYNAYNLKKKSGEGGQQKGSAKTQTSKTTPSQSLSQKKSSRKNTGQTKRTNQSRKDATGPSTFSTTEIKLLTPAQVKALGVKEAIQLVRNSAIGSLSPDAIKALGTQAARYLDVKNLSAEQFAALSPRQLAQIRDKEFANLSTAQIATLTPAKIAALNSRQSAWIADKKGNQLSTKQLNALGHKQISRIDVKQLSPKKLAGLSAKQLKKMSQKQYSEMSKAQLQALSPKTVADLGKRFQASLSTAQRAILNPTASGKKGSAKRASLAHNERIKKIIRALNYKGFKTVPPEHIKYLTPAQIASIPNSTWMNELSIKQKMALTQEQIQAINIRRISIGTLPEKKREHLSKDQVQALKDYNSFRYLPVDKIPELTRKQIASITSSWGMNQLSNKQKRAFTQEQVRAVNTSKVSIGSLPDEKRKFLTNEQVRAIANYQDFRSLPVDKIKELTPKQMASIPSTWWLDKLSNKQRNALTQKQVQALNTQKVSIGSLSEEKRKFLTTDQVQAIKRYNDLKFVPLDKFKSITPNQIASIPNTWWMDQLSNKQKTALTQQQVQAVNTSKVSIGSLPEEKRKFLTNKQVRAIKKYDALKFVPVDKIPELTPKQIATIPNTWWMDQLSDKQKMAFTQQQVQAVNTEKVSIGTLPEEKRQFLTKEQVKSIKQYNTLKFVPGDKISELTPKQISTIPNGWWMNQFSNKQKAALTLQQVQSLNTQKVSITTLPEDKRGLLSKDQIQAIKSYRDFRYLPDDKISELTPKQISDIPNSWGFNQFSKRQKKALTKKQIQALDIKKISISTLPEDKRDLLSKPQVQAIKSYQDFRYLPADKINELTPQQIATIPSTWWFNQLSSTQKNGLTQKQVQAINTKKVSISSLFEDKGKDLTKKQVQAINTKKVSIGSLPDDKRDLLTTDQIQSIEKYSDFKFVPVDKIPELTRKQLAKIPNSWWFDQLSGKQKKAFTQEQVQALNINKVSLNALPEEKLKFLSKDQIQSLTRYTEFNLVPTSRIPELTTKQLAKIPNSWWFDQLSGKQKNALTKKQIQALNTKKVSIGMLPEEKRKFLSKDQVQSITNHGELRFLPADKIKELSPQQIASFPNTWGFDQLSKKQKKALTQKQVQALNTKKVSIGSLPEEKRKFLTNDQVQSISKYSDLKFVPADKISKITPDQIATIPNSWWMNQLSSKQKEALTKKQVQALNTKKVSIGTLPDEKLKFLTTAQIQDITDQGTLKFVPVAKIKTLTTQQISKIPNSWWMNQLSRKQKEALTKNQVQALNTKKVSIGTLPEKQLKFLTKDQIRAITRQNDLRFVPVAKIKTLTTKQIAGIPSSWWMDQLSRKQKKALTKKQVQALNIKKVSIRTLPEEKLKFLTNKQVQSIISTNDFRFVPANKIKSLTTKQIASIPNSWAMNQFSFKQIHGFTSLQVKAIPKSYYDKVKGLLSKKQRTERA